MGRIRRGGYVFVTWIGDHPPRHVHVFREGRLLVKWDLEQDQAMEGAASRKLVRLIHELVEEGHL